MKIQHKLTEKSPENNRWGWFGYTPDCLQRFNTGYTWGITISLSNMAINFVVLGLMGKIIFYNVE